MPKLFSDHLVVGDMVFNTEVPDADGVVWYCDTLEGWDESVETDTPSTNNAYADGVRFGRKFTAHPRHLEFSGVAVADDRDTALKAWRKLQGLVDQNRYLTVTRYGPYNEMLEVRRTSGLRKVRDLGHSFRFSTVITAPWPYKTSVELKSAIVGAFSGFEYVREYPRSYPITYDSLIDGNTSGAATATLTNEGNATAYPVYKIHGPLLAGTWYAYNETTMERFSLGVDLNAGSILTIDTLNQTAYIGSTPVDYFLNGSWVTMPPNQESVFKLVTGEPNDQARLIIEMKDTWS